MNATIEQAIGEFAGSHDLPEGVIEGMAEDLIRRAVDLPTEEITEDWMAYVAEPWIDSVNW